MKKVLLMGPSRSGKTSMRSLIFANYLPHDTQRLALTMEIERSHVRFMGNLVLNLWDCGGQYDFIDKYLSNQQDVIFRDVAVMVYVFDLGALNKEEETEQDKWTNKRAFEYFGKCLSALKKYSPTGKLFCLLHKADLFPHETREMAIQHAQSKVMSTCAAELEGVNINFFATSVWESSLYEAWNSVIRNLIPNREFLEGNVSKIRLGCKAAHIAIFDRSTLLCISNDADEEAPPLCVTDLSDKLKRLRVAASKVSLIDTHGVYGGGNQKNAGGNGGGTNSWKTIDLKTEHYCGTMTSFTPNTLVVVLKEYGNEKDSQMEASLLRANIEYAAKRFSAFVESHPELTDTQEIL